MVLWIVTKFLYFLYYSGDLIGFAFKIAPKIIRALGGSDEVFGAVFFFDNEVWATISVPMFTLNFISFLWE